MASPFFAYFYVHMGKNPILDCLQNKLSRIHCNSSYFGVPTSFHYIFHHSDNTVCYVGECDALIDPVTDYWLREIRESEIKDNGSNMRFSRWNDPDSPIVP